MAALLPGMGWVCSGKGGLAVVLSTDWLHWLMLSAAKAARHKTEIAPLEHAAIAMTLDREMRAKPFSFLIRPSEVCQQAGTLVHGCANPLITLRFTKLAESPKALK